MRKTYWFVIGFCLIVGVAIAQFGTPTQARSATQGTKPSFEMTASYIEACSCDMFCPCYFNTHAMIHGDQQFCRANLVLRVDKGYYKGTKLDGAKVWLANDLGSDWSTGKDSWLVVNFDPSVTAEQKEALGDLLVQLYPSKWARSQTDSVPFTWNVDTSAGVATAKLSNGKGEVVLERWQGDEPNKETVIHNLKYWGAQSNTGFRMWKSKHEYYEGNGEKMDYSGTNGFLITITFSGQANSTAGN